MKLEPTRRKTLWTWYFMMAALEAGAAILALMRIPSEGLSAARLLLFAILSVIVASALLLAFRPPRCLESLARGGPILTAAALAVVLAAGLFLLRYLDPERLLPVYQRLSPLLFLLLALSVQSALFLLALRTGLHPSGVRLGSQSLRPVLLFLLFFLLVFLLISFTHLGLTPDPAYWGEVGVPMQAWQFGLALLLGLGVFVSGCRADRSGSSEHSALLSSFLFPVLIYIFAVVLWLSVPVDVLKNSFYVSLDPPTYQPFPYSDAGYYDSMAQSLFIGQPYQGVIPTRPLYILLLAGLHLLFGQRYDLIIAGQTLVLALVPVLLYLLGQKIHSRAAGIIAALFFIFREWTTLLVSSETRVSNTKTLLVDLPTLLLVLLLCLLVLRWLEKQDAKSALVAGGVFGLLLLLRTQSMLLLPVILLWVGLALASLKKPFFLLSSFFLLGLFFAIAPWLIHNYLQTGQVAFDAAFQYKLLGTQYAYTGNLDIGNFDFEGKGLGQILLQFLLKDPGFVLGFISNHFLAGWVGALLALPLIQPYNGIFAPLNLYWLDWNGNLAWYNLALVILYLSMIALGLGAAWQRGRWLGLLPLAFNVGYSLATAIGRFSGWRYDLPADWVAYFYFAVGFSELLRWIALLYGARVPLEEIRLRTPSLVPGRMLLIPALAFSLVGALPWIATGIAAPHYGDQPPAILAARLGALPGSPGEAHILSFLAGPDAVIMQGRLLYPRHFSRGRGKFSANAWPAYASRDFPRQGFLLLNASLTDALFPTRDPLDFPQGADALLLGCRRDGYVEARLLAFPEMHSSYLSAPLEAGCN